MRVMVVPIETGALDTVTVGLIQGTGGFGNNWTSGDHPNYCYDIPMCETCIRMFITYIHRT